MSRLPASVTTQHSLADLVELQRGYDLTAAERMPGEIPVIGGGGPNGTHNAANVSGPGVVVVRSGSGFGNVWWVKEDFWAHNTVMFAKSFKGNHKRFAYYVLDWLDFTSYNSGGAQPSLNRNFIYSIPIFLPSPPEQERIAGIIEIWDRAIETVEALIANARTQKRALMQQLLPQGSTPPQKRLPGFSGGWREVSLGSLGETYGGLTGKSKNDFGSGSPFITYKNVFENGFVDPKNVEPVRIKAGERQHAIRNGDILFTTSSETPEEVGMSSVVTFDADAIYLNSFCFGFRPNSADAMRPHFSGHFFRSPSMRRQIAALAQGSTRYNISKSALLKVTFHLPEADEQDAIADVMGGCDAELLNLKRHLTALRQEKAALMQQLLTGKRRVKLSESEAA